MVTKIVTGCNDCPFASVYGNDSMCNIEANNITGNYTKIEMYNGNIITPTWCPLKTQPITVMYET